MIMTRRGFSWVHTRAAPQSSSPGWKVSSPTLTASLSPTLWRSTLWPHGTSLIWMGCAKMLSWVSKIQKTTEFVMFWTSVWGYIHTFYHNASLMLFFSVCFFLPFTSGWWGQHSVHPDQVREWRQWRRTGDRHALQPAACPKTGSHRMARGFCRASSIQQWEQPYYCIISLG